MTKRPKNSSFINNSNSIHNKAAPTSSSKDLSSLLLATDPKKTAVTSGLNRFKKRLQADKSTQPTQTTSDLRSAENSEQRVAPQ